MASAYSVRPLPDARVSTPLTWDEVPTVEAEAFTIATVPARYAEIGDPGAGIDDGGRLARGAARAERAGRGGRAGRRAVAAELREAGRRAAARPALEGAPPQVRVRAGPGRRRRAAAGRGRGTGCCGRRRRRERRPPDRVGRLATDPDRPPQDVDPGRRDLAGRVQGRGARGPRALEGAPSRGRARTSSRRTSSSTGCAAARRSGTASGSTSSTSPRRTGRPRSRSRSDFDPWAGQDIEAWRAATSGSRARDRAKPKAQGREAAASPKASPSRRARA